MIDGGRALSIMAEALADGERVAHVIEGRARGLVSVVARTDRRFLVVVDRLPEPLVQSLHPTATTVSLYRISEDAPLTVAVIDRGRMLEVSGVRDEAEAHGLASTSTLRSGSGYF